MRVIKDDSQFRLTPAELIAEAQAEIDRAEGHLNEEAPYARSVALAVGAFLLLVVTQAANAAIMPTASIGPSMPPVAVSQSQDNCSTHLKNLRFAGTFVLKNRGDKDGSQPQPMRFVIGEPEGGMAGMAVAQIWSGNRCQASCSSIDFEKGDTSMPISLDLNCHSESLDALTSHVAVLWNYGSAIIAHGGPSTLLRFGSWLDGYQQATLKVELDHFNSLNIAKNTLNPDAPNPRVTKLAFRAPGLPSRMPTRLVAETEAARLQH